MRGYLFINDDLKEKYFNLCFDAYWKDDLDISDEKNIDMILNNIGFKSENFFNGIKDLKIKEKLKDLTKNAFDKDIFGAPTFVVNNKIFWGQDRLDYALDEYNS
tara:strand:- start:672 stop:983 length:312 start_codon:yes stop_codon:yes gene_type:complete